MEFSRDRKMMSVLCQKAASRPVLFVKGAPETVLERCTQASASIIVCSKNATERFFNFLPFAFSRPSAITNGEKTKFLVCKVLSFLSNCTVIRCLEVSTLVQVAEDSTAPRELTSRHKKLFLDKVAEFGSQSALRCLALASRQMPPGSQQVLSKASSLISWILKKLQGCRSKGWNAPLYQ